MLIMNHLWSSSREAAVKQQQNKENRNYAQEVEEKVEWIVLQPQLLLISTFQQASFFTCPLIIMNLITAITYNLSAFLKAEVTSDPTNCTVVTKDRGREIDDQFILWR